MKTLAVFAGGLLLALLALAGCGGGSGLTNDIQGVGNPGAVRVLIADAPLDGIKAVNVTITRVDLLYDGREDSLSQRATDETPAPTEGEIASPDADDTTPPEDNDQYVTVFTGEKTVNLLEMANKPLSELAAIDAPLPSGHYKQIRITVQDGSVVLQDDTTLPLKVPSGVIRLRTNLFVNPDQTETVVIDFDLSAPGSLHLPGNGQWYVLTPMLRLMRARQCASVSGSLRVQGITAPVSVAGLALVAQGQTRATVVRLQPDGADLVGNFVVHGLPAGTYTLTGKAIVGEQTFDFTRDVTVTAGQTTALGEVVLPTPTPVPVG